MNRNSLAYVCALALVSSVGCGDDTGATTADASQVDTDASTACTVTAWSAPSFATNAAVALALRDQIDQLAATAMRGAEQETIVVDEVSDLTALYEAGDPSIADIVTPAFDAIADDVFADFVALIAAGPRDLVDENGDWMPGADGGIFGTSTRGINAGGLEVRQILDKGWFGGAVLYRYALSLTEGPITEATIDALAAAWGTNDTLSFEERTDSANYSYGMGFHAPIAQVLTEAKAYAANPNCTAERDAAIVTLFRTWELAMVARTLFYANAASTTIAAATTDDELAAAFHELSEGLGLTLGFLGLTDPSSGPLSGEARVITDQQIETIMTALGVNIADLSASTTGSFIETPGDFATAVSSVESTVMAIYGLSAADIESYRAPTPG